MTSSLSGPSEPEASQPFEFFTEPEPWRDYRTEFEADPEFMREFSDRVFAQARDHLAEQGLTIACRPPAGMSPVIDGDLTDPTPLRFKVAGHAIPMGQPQPTRILP